MNKLAPRPNRGCRIGFKSYKLVLFILYFAIALPAYAVEITDIFSPAIDTVAMLSGTLRGIKTYGAGIVFAHKGKNVYIATANHLVRKMDSEMSGVTVRLKNYPDLELPATLLEEYSPDPEFDLALLKATLPESLSDGDLFDFHVLTEPGTELTNCRVYPIGRVNNRLWSRPISFSQGVRREGTMLFFESFHVRPGSSGGGLIEESGTLLGMVLKDNPPYTEARDIHHLINAIKILGYPVDLRLAYAYHITGKWIGKMPFGKISLERQGNHISGTTAKGTSDNFNIHPPTRSLVERGIEVKMINLSFLEANIEGKIQCNRLLLHLTGVWGRETIVTGPRNNMQYNDIKFSALLNGHVKANEIKFDYKFESGAEGNLSEGSFVAKREIVSNP